MVTADQPRISCKLSGGYQSLADLMKTPEPGPDSLTDKLYEQILDCVDALAPVL